MTFSYKYICIIILIKFWFNGKPYIIIFLDAGDILSDTNCNGIFGMNLTSGLAYEEELCGGKLSSIRRLKKWFGTFR